MAKRNQIRRFARNVSRKAEDVYDDAKERIEDTKESAEDLIQEHPFASIAVAAAVGALVALGVNALVSREKKSTFRKFRDYFD